LGTCTPSAICACLTGPSSAQIAALKDHKDKVKPVFLFYKVSSVLAAAHRLVVRCLPRADGGANPAACKCLALTARVCAGAQKGTLKKTIEGVNGPEIQKLCDSI
jgi:hypothetical protein